MAKVLGSIPDDLEEPLSPDLESVVNGTGNSASAVSSASGFPGQDLINEKVKQYVVGRNSKNPPSMDSQTARWNKKAEEMAQKPADAASNSASNNDGDQMAKVIEHIKSIYGNPQDRIQQIKDNAKNQWFFDFTQGRWQRNDAADKNLEAELKAKDDYVKAIQDRFGTVEKRKNEMADAIQKHQWEAGDLGLKHGYDLERDKARQAWESGEKSRDRGLRREELNLQRAMRNSAAQPRPGPTVPGFEIEEGANPTPDDAKKLKQSLASKNKIDKYVDELTALHGKYGTEMGGSKAGTRMKQLVKQIQLEAKNIGELGALSGPDMGLIEDLISADPTSLWSNVKGMVGADTTKSALEGVKSWSSDQVGGNASAFGYKPSGNQSDGTNQDMVKMISPDGKIVMVPKNRAQAALKAGGKLHE